jgi:transposase-like protein
MKAKIETVAQAMARKRSNGAWPPLRSFKELADEFGLSHDQLKKFLQYHEGPAPVVIHKNKRTERNSWYDHTQMRKWWKQIQERKGVNA